MNKKTEEPTMLKPYVNQAFCESDLNINNESVRSFASHEFNDISEQLRPDTLSLDNTTKIKLNSNSNDFSYSSDTNSVNAVDAPLFARESRTRTTSLSRTISHNPELESSLNIAKQVALPYILAAIGLVAAGLVLDEIQHWDVLIKIKELYVLVPSLLGLKGNLEMTLASRISTSANSGILKCKVKRSSIIIGNIVLIQCQAAVIALFAALIAMTMSWVSTGRFNLTHAFILCSAALYTAAIASLILSTLMIFIIVKSHENGIDPDNVATPIAASLGDLITLGLLSFISRFLYWAKDTPYHWLIPLSMIVFLCLVPIWVYIANENEYTTDVLRHGWEPVIVAIFISSTGGFILERAVNQFGGIAIYTPGMNGVGGNLAAVQASRISTYLHVRGKPGHYIPEYIKEEKFCDCSTFTSFFNINMKNPHQRSALVLWALTIPGHILVLVIIQFFSQTIKAGHTTQTSMFILIYLIAAVIQVGILLKLAIVVTHKLWIWGDDPDNSAIPYLTAFGDLIGQILLFAAFEFLYLIGDRDSDVGE